MAIVRGNGGGTKVSIDEPCFTPLGAGQLETQHRHAPPILRNTRSHAPACRHSHSSVTHHALNTTLLVTHYLSVSVVNSFKYVLSKNSMNLLCLSIR